MEKMINYMLSPEAMVLVSGSSIGTQKKFYEKGFWYKQNNLGYEGLSEYLSSLILSCSNVSEYVAYERCKINGRDGCRSENFLKPGESYISLQRLYDTYHGGQLSERIRLLDSVKERIQFVTEYVEDTTGLDIKEQLSKILTFDMLVLNTDRHFNNLGIIADVSHNLYKNAPIFDNGNALLSNVGAFEFEVSVEKNIEKTVGQPFSANLERQAWEAGFGFKVNYRELQKILQKEPDSRAMAVLQFQLDRYENIIKDNTIEVKNHTDFIPVKESVLNKLADFQTKVSQYESDKTEKHRESKEIKL